MEIDVRHAKYEELEEVNRLREMVNELHVNGRPGWFRPGFGDELKNFIYEFYDGDNNDVIVAVNKGIHRIELDYWAFNEGAEKFYEAVGFKVFRKYTEMYV